MKYFFVVLLSFGFFENIAIADDAKAIELFKKSFEDLAKAKTKKDKLSAKAMISLSSLLAYLPMPAHEADAKQIFELIKKGSDLEISCAQFALSQLYWNGYKSFDKGSEIVEINKELSTKLLEKSANNGCSDAQYGLAISYQYGQGLIENDRLAARWMEKAALSGKAEAMVQFAIRLMKGQGIKKSKSTALSWLIVADFNSSQISSNEVKESIGKFKAHLKEDLSQNEIENSQQKAKQLQKQIEKNTNAFEG